MKKRLYAVCLAALLAAGALGCTHKQDGEAMARQLLNGMTMTQVIETFGEPHSAGQEEWKQLLNVEDSALAQMQKQALLYKDVQYLSQQMDLVILLTGTQQEDTVTSFWFMLCTDRDACLAAERTAAAELQRQWGEPERMLGEMDSGTLQDDLLWAKWEKSQLEVRKDEASGQYCLVITQHVR